MKQLDDVVDKIHAEMVKKYATNPSEYTSKSGRNLIFSPDIVSFFIHKYFESRDLTYIKRIHFEITRNARGIKPIIKQGDETEEGKLDAKKYLYWKKYGIKSNLMRDYKEQYNRESFWMQGRYKENKHLAVVDLMPVTIAKNLEEFFQSRCKGILLRMMLACDVLRDWYYELQRIYEQAKEFESTQIYIKDGLQ